MPLRGTLPVNRVLLLGEIAPFGWGGPASFIKNLALTLVREDRPVLVLTTAPLQTNLAMEMGTSGIQIEMSPKFLRKPLPRNAFFRVLRYLVEVFQLATWLRKQRPFSTIIISTTSPGRFFSPFGPAKRALFFLHSAPSGRWHSAGAAFFRALLPNSAILSCVSQFTADQVIERWGLKRRSNQIVTVLNPAPDVGNVLFEPSRRLEVLTVASATEDKNPLLWLSSAERFIESHPTNVVFRWVGDGPDLDWMREWVQKRSLARFIHLEGFQPNVAVFYEKALISLQLSKRENAPISILESLSFGVPVLATGVGGIPELVQHGVTGSLLCSPKPDDVAQELWSLMRNKDRLKDMSSSAIQDARGRLSRTRWESQVEELVSIINGKSRVRR